MTENYLDLLGKAIEHIVETKVAEKQTTHTAVTLHDGAGIFSIPGLNREVLTAHMMPQGIGNMLPLVPSIDTDPRYATITGFTAATGTEPTGACEAAPTSYMKGCTLTSTFGLVRRDTNDIEFDKVMRRYNRGDFTDLILMGGLIGSEDAASGMIPSGLNPDQVLNNVTMAEMLTTGISSQRVLINQMWQGNPAITNQFPGLDLQIATGQVDSDTNIACPALDSSIYDFGLNDVCGTTQDIVEQVSSMAYRLAHIGMQTGMTPVKWVIAMRPTLWYELTACWPCRYQTNRCTSSNGTVVGVINDENNTRMRDEMRNGMFLWVNGEKYPVVIDDGIFEHDSANNANLNPGEFASSIYFVPLSVLGRVPVTFRNYLNYRDPLADANVRLLNGRNDFWTDNGIFSWAYVGNRWCYNLALKTEQRVVLLTPQLAGKIQNVRYTPAEHLRDSDPDSPYFRDGGLSVRTINRKYMVGVPGGIGIDH